MSFIQFVDTQPTLFDDTVLPLNGRLTFLDFNTDLKKSIYLDTALTIEAENPHYTNAMATLEHEIYLSTGQYKVKYEKFIGSGDPKVADDTDFVPYKTTQQFGLVESDAIAGVEKIIVNTIDDLRAVDVSKYNVVEVLGYYNAGDCVSRNYIWTSGNTQADNYGSIIQSTGVFTGRWLMQEPEEMDSRYFGIFPSLTNTYNSQLTSLISWMASSYAKCKSIRFGTGTYTFIAGTFTFNSKVIMEKDVKFAISGAGTLNININADYDIQTMNPLVLNSAALANVIISFTGSKSTVNNIVKSDWYGNWSDYTNGDSASLIAMSSRVAKNYVIHITTQYFATSGTATFHQDLEFYQGQIQAKGGDVIFTNNKLSSPESTTTRLLVATGGNWNNFRFTNGAIARSSLFASTGFQTILAGLQTNSGTGAKFIFDSNVTFSGTFTDNGAFTYIHEKGQITANTQEQYATFNSFECSDSGQKFAGNDCYVAIKNQEVKITWFMPVSPSQSQEQNALKNSLRCACMGSGLLNLQNTKLEIKSGFNILNVDSSLQVIKVYDGQIIANNSNAMAMIIIKEYGSDLIFENVYFYSLTGIYAEFLRLDGTAASFANVIFDNCTMFIGSDSIVFTTINGAQVSWFRYINGFTRYGWLCADPNAVSVQIINNYYYGSWTSILNSRPMFQNNYCESAYEIRVRCLNSAMITGNRFYETALILYDNGGGMDGIINSNQFESSSSWGSRIRLISATKGTLMKGLTIVGNSFTGNLNTIMIAISVEGSYAGLGHHIKVTGNTTTEFNIKVPQTEGSSRNIKFYVTEGTNEVRLYLTGVNENTYNIFYIPGAMDPLDYIASTINHGIQSALFYLQSDGNVYQTCYTVINSTVPGAPTTDFQGSRANWSIYSSWEQ